jgi:hypothetical protein
MPFVKGRQIVIAENSIVVTITGSYSRVTQITYTIKVTNNGIGSRNFTGNEMRVRYTSKGYYEERESAEVFATDTPANFSVGEGETKTLTGTIAVTADLDLYYNTRRWVKLGSLDPVFADIKNIIEG